MNKKVSILITGDEIINGTTLDTNSNFYASTLYQNKILTSQILKVRDNIEDIKNALDYLEKISDGIVISGGLGPTSDDITRYGLQKHLNVELVEDEDSINHIKERLLKSNMGYTAQNFQQALFPNGATVIKNHNGSANSCHYKSENKKDYFMIPGPPKEAHPIFEKDIISYFIDNNYCQDFKLQHYRLLGIAESVIANEIDEIVKGKNIQTAFCVKMPYLDIFLTAKEMDANIKLSVENAISDYLVTETFETGSDILRKLIESLGNSIAINDIDIGNSLSVKLLSPKTRKLISNSTHNAEIKVTISGLKEYWNNENERLKSELCVQVEINNKNYEEKFSITTRGSETLTIASEYAAVVVLKILNPS